MKDSSSQSNVRWNELHGPLSAFAKSEGKPKSQIARDAVRTYLEGKGISLPKAENKAPGPELRSCMGVRFGDLLERLEIRAVAERTTCSVITRRAVRLYLANGEVPQILKFMDELRQHHVNMARIGGNLNRIARLINADGVLAKSELGIVHLELIEAFKPLADTYKRVEKALERQKP